MHTQSLSFGLDVPKTADRCDRIVFSKDGPRKWHFQKNPCTLRLCERPKPAGGTRKHVPESAWEQDFLHYTSPVSQQYLVYITRQTQTNAENKFVMQSLIFNPVSEKHLWTLSPKWNNCVNGISKVTLTPPSQENSCTFVPFSSSLYASAICLSKEYFHAWLHFFSLQRGKKFYQSSVTWGWNPFSTAFSVQQWNIWTPAGNCTYSLKIMISFSNIFAANPCLFFQHIAICSN